MPSVRLFILEKRWSTQVLSIDKLTLAIKRNSPLQHLLNHIEQEQQADKLPYRQTANGAVESYPYNGVRIEPQRMFNRSHYKHNFDLHYNGVTVGMLQVETYQYNANKYAYLTIYNECLYNRQWLLYKQITERLHLTISHITRLDIARDTTTDPTRKYLRIVSDPSHEIIINGKLVKDRDKLLRSPYFISTGTLNNPMQQHSIYLQSEDKTLIARGYCKTNEVKQHSGKQYQLHDEEGKPLYRLEVSIGGKQLRKHDEELMQTDETPIFARNETPLLQRIEHPNQLGKLYYQYLQRLFRYSRHGDKRQTL